jgi:HEPN domain-containing protein
MRLPPPRLNKARRDVRLWWEQARHDLETAEHNLAGDRYDAAIFFCQQAVEKALKALTIQNKRHSAGPTHSLITLGRLCGVPKKYSTFLRTLTSEYFLSRYPDAAGEVPYTLYDGTEARQYLETSKELLQWVARQLPRSSAG